MKTMRLAVGALIAFSLAGCSAAEPDRGDVGEDVAAATGDFRHGVWVYGVDRLLKSPDARNDLVKFALANKVNNIYLSVKLEVFDNGANEDELTKLLERLFGNGIFAEALLGSDTGYDAVKNTLDKVLTYNSKYKEDPDLRRRFRGLHLDFEPWKNTGADNAWVDGLIRDYREVARQLEVKGVSIPIAADVSGAKMIDDAIVSPQKRQAILDSVTRLVLMQYETPNDQTVINRTAAFFAGVGPSSARVIVAVRSADFPDAALVTVNKVEETFKAKPAYGGWSIYDYCAWRKLQPSSPGCP